MSSVYLYDDFSGSGDIAGQPATTYVVEGSVDRVDITNEEAGGLCGPSQIVIADATRLNKWDSTAGSWNPNEPSGLVKSGGALWRNDPVMWELPSTAHIGSKAVHMSWVRHGVAFGVDQMGDLAGRQIRSVIELSGYLNIKLAYKPLQMWSYGAYVFSSFFHASNVWVDLTDLEAPIMHGYLHQIQLELVVRYGWFNDISGGPHTVLSVGMYWPMLNNGAGQIAFVHDFFEHKDVEISWDRNKLDLRSFLRPGGRTPSMVIVDPSSQAVADDPAFLGVVNDQIFRMERSGDHPVDAPSGPNIARVRQDAAWHPYGALLGMSRDVGVDSIEYYCKKEDVGGWRIGRV